MKLGIYKKPFTRVFIVALFTITPNLKNLGDKRPDE